MGGTCSTYEVDEFSIRKFSLNTRREQTTKMNLKELGCVGVDWIQLMMRSSGEVLSTWS
jgi:hypothetical protein